MKKFILTLAAWGVVAAGGWVPLCSAHAAVPDCWKPYLQPDRPTLSVRDIGKNAVVIASRDNSKLVVYDREEDRWQEWLVPKGYRMKVAYPHVWLTSATANGKYWDLNRGVACRFQALPDDLFVRPIQLPDQGVRPLALTVDARIWSWIPTAKTYRCFDPFADHWQDLPKAEELPAARSVCAVTESAELIRIVLGPQSYCIMRDLDLNEYSVGTYAKRKGTWSVVKSTAQADLAKEEYVAAGNGWWLIRNGAACWHPKETGESRDWGAVWYGICKTNGKLWGWADDRFVEVAGIDEHTGDPKPTLTKRKSLSGLFAYDGTYIWQWYGGRILRHTPGVCGTKEYRTVRGVIGWESDPQFTSRAIWFKGVNRYDKHTRTWKRIVWKGAPLPENNVGFQTAVTETETFILVFEFTASAPKYRGMARYDPSTNIATYWTGEQIASGKWPFGSVSPVESRPKEDSLSDLVGKAWNLVRHQRGLCGRPWTLSGEMAVIKEGKLRIQSRLGDSEQIFEYAELGLPDIVTKNVLWFLTCDGRHAVVLDRQTGEVTKLPKGFGAKKPVVGVSFYRDEAVVMWRNLDNHDKHGMCPTIACAVLDLNKADMTVLSRRDFYRFDGRLSEMTIEGDWFFPTFAGQKGFFMAAKHRPTGRWVPIPYLTERVWFDEDYAYAYIGDRFHRAEKSAFLQTLAPK